LPGKKVAGASFGQLMTLIFTRRSGSP